MRAAPAVLRLALCLSSVTPIVSAWPGWLPRQDSLYVRQDESSSEETSATGEQRSSTEESTQTTDSTAEETTGTNTRDQQTTTTGPRDQNTAVAETGTGTRTGTRSGSSTRTSFDPAGYPGGVSMITPDPTQVATALYKIGDNIELAWNYTSLQATPTAVDVLVSCSAASETWTLTANMTFETEVNYIWESKDDADNVDKPLLTEMYTLIIKDVDADVTQRPEAGYLGAFSGFKFGLYRPQAYTPLSEWQCDTCNGGMGAFDSQALKLAITMAFITVCSFTWFVTGLGLQ